MKICHAGAEATAARQEAEAADTAHNPQQGRAEEFRSLYQEQRAAIDAAAAQRTAAADEVIGLATRKLPEWVPSRLSDVGEGAAGSS